LVLAQPTPLATIMLIVAPEIISVLSHVTVLLFAILIAVLSAWTTQRVRKASARSPFELSPPTSPSNKLVRRASERITRLVPKPVPKRSLSQGSILIPSVNPQHQLQSSTGSPSPPCFRQTRSYSISPSCIASHGNEKSEISAYTWQQQHSEFGRWLVENNQECNSPTGTLLDEPDKGSWLPLGSQDAQHRASIGRRIISIIGLIRGLVAIPAVILYSNYGSSSVSTLSTCGTLARC
jgi:hypothetical protein